MNARWIDLAAEDRGETVVMRMSVTDAYDLADVLDRDAKYAYDPTERRALADKLRRFAEGLEPDTRPGLRIVLVPR